MQIPHRAIASLLGLVCSVGLAEAQTLPPPRPLPPQMRLVPVMPPAGQPLPVLPYFQGPPPGVFLPPVGYRPSAYRWQYYGRNYSGYFLPRVIYAADGEARYLLGGIPMPWIRNYPGEFYMPLSPN